VITIPVGQSSGSVTVAAPADSPYVDPSTITVSITGTQGGGFNQIITGPSTTTQINDTVDTTTVTLDAPAQVNEGGQITYSASVNNAPQSDLVLTLSNGASITIKAGELSGSVTVDAPSDDVYKDGSSLTVSITGSSGGNYEQLDTSSKVTTEVADTVDTTTATLTATPSVTEGGVITYTVTLSHPAQGAVGGERDPVQRPGDHGGRRSEQRQHRIPDCGQRCVQQRQHGEHHHQRGHGRQL